MTPEKKVKDSIRALLKEIGAWHYMPVPMGFGGASVDFLVCWRGRFYAIEAKRPDGGGRLTPRQRDTLAAIEAAGGAACVEDSVECAAVRRMLGV